MMSVRNTEISVQELLTQLCSSYYTCSRKFDIIKLKSRLNGILLRFQAPKNSLSNANGIHLDDADMLYAEVHRMTNHREFDRASELQLLLHKLMDINGQIPDEILRCLKFLLCLTRWSTEGAPALGGPWKIPTVIQEYSDIICMASKSPFYGDTRVYKAEFHFQQFSNEMFETVSQMSTTERDNLNNQVFEAVPGLDDCGGSIFHYFQQEPRSYAGKSNPSSLFGAVKFSQSLNDFSLCLPILTDYRAQNPMAYSLDFCQLSRNTNSNYEQQKADDEGFIDSENNQIVPIEPPDPTKIWEKVSKLGKLPKRSWDHKNELHSGSPFLCRSGACGTDVMHQSLMKQLRLINPSLNESGLSKSGTSSQTFQHLIEDVINLLLGVQSNTFLYDKQKHLFRLRSNLPFTSLSAQPLLLVLEDFLDCGSLYLKMESFAQPQELGTYLHNGLVMECLKEGVSHYLQHYRGCILYIKETQSNTLLSLHMAVYKAYRQLRYLTDLCLGDRQILSRVRQQSSLPKGLKLLTYLFQNALQEWGGDNYLLLLFLLKRACTPYFRFLHDWVFEGTLNDPYNEFNIQANENCLTNKHNKCMFWSYGYVLKEKVCAVPFLGEIVNQSVLLCGKSLNLLKICDPKHSLLDSRHQRPHLELSLTSAGLLKSFEESTSYYNTLSFILKPDQFESFEETVAANLKKADVPVKEKPSKDKKRAVVAELDLGVRNKVKDVTDRVKAKEMEEEAEVMSNVEELKLIEEVKLEVNEEYARLMKAAEMSKQKLLWQARRLELNKKRTNFLRNKVHGVEERISQIDPFGVHVQEHREECADTIQTSSNVKNVLLDIPRMPCQDELSLTHDNVLQEITSELNYEGLNEDNKEEVEDVEQILEQEVEEDGQQVAYQITVETKERKEAVEIVMPDAFKSDLGKDIAGSDLDHIESSSSSFELDLDKVLCVTIPEVQPYQAKYSSLDSLPHENLLVSLNVFGPSTNWDKNHQVACLSIPLPVFFQRSVNPPLEAQAKLVNCAVLRHFNEKLQLGEHLNILRNIFFFIDGEFGRKLSHLIYQKASSLGKFRDLLNPFVLRSVMNTALSSSHSGDNLLSENFCLGPKLGCNTPPAPDFAVLLNLELKYKVEWPLDIVLSQNCEELYNRIFSFLLQINYVVWKLTDAWYRLKQYDLLYHFSGHWQFRQIQVFRHEMLHFVQTVHEFVCSQILQSTWQEFQADLNGKVEDLDQLCNAHMDYLQKTCSRCMLGGSVDASLQKSLETALKLALQFHNKLVMLPWQQGLPIRDDYFVHLTTLHQQFKLQVRLLCTALKLNSLGRQNQHLFYFLLLLDVGDYYKSNR